MKKITTITIMLCIAYISNAQLQSFINLDAGYVTDHHKQLGCFYGIEYKNDKTVYPFIEAGARLQLTQDAVTDFTSANAGIAFQSNNFFLRAKAGIAFCFNRQVKDIHKLDDGTEITLYDGAETSTFFSSVKGLQIGYNYKDVPIYVEYNYAGDLHWIGAGIKILF